MSVRELDSLRPQLLQALLTTPHRKLGELYPVHLSVIDQDPLFYVHLAAWYARHGAVRDHMEVFATVLGLARDAGDREVGLALLRDLPPYQVARVVDFIKGREVKRRELRPGATAIKHEKGKKMRVTKEMVAAAYIEKVDKVGLFRVVPRSMRTEVARYLRERERNPEGFDRAVLAARSALKRLYAGLRIKPGARAQAILFEDSPPVDSELYQLKLLQGVKDAADIAQVIVDYRIPYRVAVSVVKEMSPSILAALIDAMTPAELLNNIASLKERGAMDNADLKALIDGKIKAAKTDKRVSAMKGTRAAKSAALDADTSAALEEVTQKQVEARGVITRATAVLIDKSTSQATGIEAGKQLATLVAGICKAPLFVYAFDTVAYPLIAAGTDLKHWEAAFRGINAHGNTSCGIPLAWMARQRQLVDQIVLVTDEGENTPPTFEAAYTNYVQVMGVRPSITLLRVGSEMNVRNDIRAACQRMKVEINAIDFKGDYFSLPNLIPHLTGQSQADLVMTILAFPLPRRRAT